MTQPVFLVSVLMLAAAFGQQSPNFVGFENYSCRTEIDSITKHLVYITADTEPMNEGGKIRLTREFESKIVTNNIASDAKDYDPNVIVAFIVDKDGTVKGERVISDKTRKVGKQMLAIIKLFKWTPAQCNGELVPMMVKQKMIIEIAEK